MDVKSLLKLHVDMWSGWIRWFIETHCIVNLVTQFQKTIHIHPQKSSVIASKYNLEYLLLSYVYCQHVLAHMSMNKTKRIWMEQNAIFKVTILLYDRTLVILAHFIHYWCNIHKLNNSKQQKINEKHFCRNIVSINPSKKNTFNFRCIFVKIIIIPVILKIHLHPVHFTKLNHSNVIFSLQYVATSSYVAAGSQFRC